MWCIKWCGLLWALVQEYAFLVSLLVLYVGGLSKIDLIHSIYMLFFVVFVVFPNVRRTRWRLLVGYSGMVVAAIFVYKVISEAGTEADLPVSQQPPIIIEIGLDASLPGRLSAPGELITGHYIFPISMIIFWAASLQMSLYTEQSASARRERLDGFAGMLPEKLLKWIAQGGTAYQHYGVYALCVIFLCLGLQNRIKMTNLTDLIAVIVLLGMGLMFSGKPFETTQKRVFRILAFLSFLKGLELFTRYLFQYEIVCKFITPIFQCQCTCTEGGNEKAGLNCTSTAHNSSDSDMCSFIFQEIGLTQDPYLYRALFDSTAVFVVIVLQLKYSHGFSQSRSVPCGREGKDEEKEDARTELDIDIATPDHVGCCEILAKRSVNMIQFLLYYNMGKLTLFCSALMALFEDESAISLALLIMVLFYLQVCMGKMKQPAWHGAWRPFFIVSSVSMVCQYIFEFSIFRTGEWLSPIATNISAWIGLDHHSEKIPAELSSYGEMWSVFGLQAMVMTVCAVHRWSHTLRESVMSIEKLWSTEEKPDKLSTMWQHSEQQQQQRRRPRSPLSCGLQFRLGARWYLSTHMNYDLAILSLLLSAFVHIDIRSIGYMFFVLYATMKGRSKAMAGFHLMQWFVMSSIIYQCVLSTQFPVGTSLQQWWEDVLSGFHQAPGVGHWFTFMNQDNKTAVFDFCAVFFAKLHTNPRFEKLENTPERGETKTNMRSNSERYPNMDNTDVDYTDNNDFTVDTSGFCDWMLCLIHELSVPLLFALCVLVGMAYPEYGLLGLGYVIFGAAHLSRFSPEPSKRYKLRHLRGIRFYNWLVMFATVVYQAPWIPVAPSFQDAGGSLDYAFKYNNTCESRLVTRECMRDFASTFAQLSGLPKMSPPFDPDYPGNCGCNATIFDMARNGNISTICGAHGKDCCAEPTCASSFKKRRNVLSIAMFMFISFVCHVISSPSHKFYVDARRRRHATALRKSNNINMVVLRKLTNTWKQLTRRKFLMEMRLRRVISLVTDLQYEVSGARESSSMIRRWIVPPRMSPLIVVDATSSSVTLRWEPLEDDVSSSILDYIIQRDESGSALLSVYEHDIVVDKEEAIEMQWTVNGLSPRTDYDFVISARNETGTGRPSLPTRASTLPDEDEVGDGNRTCLDAEQGISGSQADQQSEDSYFGAGEGKMKEERLPGTDLEEFGAREHESKSQKDEDGASKTTTQCHQSFWPWLEKALVLLAKTMETNDGKLDAAGNSPQLDSNSNDWTRLLWHALLSQTGGAIPIMLVLFAILHSSLYALALPVSYFIYAVWQSPRVRVGYWDFLVGYILCTIVLRFLVQLPLFCFNSTSEGSSLRLSVQPFCPSSGSEQISTIKALADESVNPLHLFFFYKKEDADFFGYLWVDILAVLTIILHKHQLYMRGLWQMDTHVSTRNSRLMNLVKNGGLQTLPASASYWQQGIAFARRVLPMLDKGSASQFDARRAMSLLDGTEDPDIVETQTPKCDDPSPVVLRKAPSSSQFCSKDLCEADRRFMDYILDTLGPSVTLKPGTEHYTLGTAAQMSSCLFLFLFTTAMTSKSGDVSESIAVITGSSTFSKTMVLLLMYHIAVMMFDRAALLCQDLRLKIAVLCVTVLFTHYFVFIYVQKNSHRWIEDNPTLLIYYFLQLTFALASGWQIREGYCVFPTTSQTQDEDYNACASIIYKTWRGIPLMREMRSIFNWIFSETSLDVFMWLQMDDLYATLAIVKFNMSYRVRDKETLSGKNRQPFLWKFVFGWLIFILILLILLGPIFLFSPLNPATKPNPLVQASVSVSLSAGTKMSNELKYTLFQSSNHTNVTSPVTSSSVSTCVGKHSDKTKLRKVNETGQMQLVMLPTYSDELWSVTPSAIAHFRMLLLDRDGLIMKITLNYQFVRNKPEGQTVTAGEFHIDITNPSRCALAARLGASNASLTSAKCNLTRQAIVSGYTVNFTNAEFYPPILHVSSTKDAAGPENISSDTLGLSLRLDGSSADDVSRWVNNPGKNLDPTLWWTAHAISNWDCEGEGVPTDEGIVFVVFSDDAPAGAAQLILTSLGGGLIAVYIFLVGTVASYVRGFLFNPIYNVPFTEIPYPELLLEVCEGIKIMRVSGYEGHRRDEVLTYKFLVDVIRSSYLLSRLTNTREQKKKVKEE